MKNDSRAIHTQENGFFHRFTIFATMSMIVAFMLLTVQLTWAQSQENAIDRPGHFRPYPFRLKHDVPTKFGSHPAPAPEHGSSLLNTSPIFPGPSGAQLTYYGGPIVSNIEVIVVFYGSGSYLPNLSSDLPPFFTTITNGTFIDMLSEYGTVGISGGSNQLIQHGTYGASYQITPSAGNDGSTIDDSNIQAELIAQINAGHLPAPLYDANGNSNTMYMIYFPNGKTITQGGSSSCVAGGFCAYHGTINNAGRDVLYGVQPDMQAGSGCDVGCGNGATPFDNYSSVASHEFSETITDAAVGLATTFSPPLAWYDSTNGEIGDICNAIQSTADGYTVQTEWSNLQGGCASGPVTFTVTAPANATAGTAFNVTVTALRSDGTNEGSAFTDTVHFSSTDGSATLPADYTFTTGDNGSHTFGVTLNTSGSQTITVTGAVAIGFRGTSGAISVGSSTPNFSISASPTSVSIQQGNSGSSTISTTAMGPSGTVSLSVSGMPSGASASLNPTSVTTGGSSTLSVNTGTAAAGTYTLTVTGTEGSNIHSASVTVTITATPDFTISASPSSVSVQQGHSGTSTISTAVAGSSGTVNLAVSGVPSGATASLSPTSVTAGNSSTLTINAGTAATGTYTVTVTGTEGSKGHSTTVTLTVTTPPSPDFTISASPSSLSVQQGHSGTSTISTTAVGSSGTVNLTVSGAPSGTTASLSPTSVTAGSSSTLTINVGTTTTAGTYTLTVTGTEGANTHSAAVTLTVTSTPPPNFTISASPTSLSINQGGSGNSTISTTVVNASGTISLTVSGATNGVTASVSPASVTAGSSATLTVSVSSTATSGNYTITVTGTEGSNTHSTTVSVTVMAVGGGSISNGGFETGTFSGWATAGASETIANSGCHSGTYCAMLGSTSPTNGDSTISQTFMAPTGTTGISLWYKMTCPDTVTYDWATVSLKDNTANTTAILLPRTCTTNTWTNVTSGVTAGHSYTLTLTSHDDNYPGDPSYTLYDDVTLTTGGGGNGITNGGFETGTFSGWTTSGASETIVSSGCHSGTYCAMLGSTSPTNGDSSASQTFTIPAGKSQLSIWYNNNCPDTVTYDWTTVTLRNNSTGTTTTVLARACTSAGWRNVTTSVTAATSYTLTLTSHDDNYPGDPTFTLYDDVTLN